MIQYIKSHEEHAVTPLTISPMHNAWPSKLLINLLDGHRVGEKTFCVHEDQGLSFYTGFKAWDNGSDYLIEKIKKDKNFVRFIYKKSLEISKKLTSEFKGFSRKDITKLTDKQLAEFLSTSYDLALELTVYGYVPVLSDHYFQKFTHLLKNVIKQAVAKTGQSENIPEALQLLSTSSRLIPSKRAHIELLKLATVAEDKLENRIKKYYKDWFWVNFGHMGPSQSYKETRDSILIMRRDKVKALKDLNQLISHSKELEVRHQSKSSRLELSAEAKYLFSVARDFMFLKGLRMETLFGMFAEWDRCLTEIARRLKIEKKLLYYCSIDELAGWVRSGRAIGSRILEQRQKRSLWLALAERKQKIFVGRAATKFFRSADIKTEEIKKNVLVIHGTVASLGYAKGPVKIVNKTSEIHKVEKGDILVSVATHPGLLPAMQKAVGFVTDAGGITSHAAIVAREMKKPCVIGTKIATKVLRDGDIIELDTKKGDIKIVYE